MNPLLMTYYGDDFTGSTDAMEALTLGGVPTILFLEPPTTALLSTHFPNARAVGVAGIGRSLTPAQMDIALPPIFSALKDLNAPLCHYKICSTFDSSPTIGSIGRALELGYDVFAPAFVPIVVGAPPLKRYVVFGNLFATVRGETFRLDRHPTMSKHPITPMHESDLRLHLAQQTQHRIGLVDVLHLAQGDAAINACVLTQVEAGNTAVLFDTLDDGHLQHIGRVLWNCASNQPIFTVGSSGVEYALTAWWRAAGVVPPPAPIPAAHSVEQIIAMSGSASPTTAEQIAWAETHGFDSIRIDVPRLLDPATFDEECEALSQRALAVLARGYSPLLYAARGPDDPAIALVKAAAHDPEGVGQRLGTVQGQVLRRILERTSLTRICVAGGDTCGHVVQQLGMYALSFVAPLAPGSPLCRAYAHDVRFDQLELSLKGGQVGQAGFFGHVRDGFVS